MISKENAEHYVWGDDCDGWYLVNLQDMLIIHEKMPAGTSEKRHFHSVSRQFFFVLCVCVHISSCFTSAVRQNRCRKINAGASVRRRDGGCRRLRTLCRQVMQRDDATPDIAATVRGVSGAGLPGNRCAVRGDQQLLRRTACG